VIYGAGRIQARGREKERRRQPSHGWAEG